MTNSFCVFMAAVVVLIIIGCTVDVYAALASLLPFCFGLIPGVFSCIMPKSFTIPFVTTRHHYCPLCKRGIGFSTQGILTPDHLADMA